MSVAVGLVMAFVGVAIFAVGLSLGWAWRARRVVGLDRPATLRDIRDHGDRIIFVVVADQAQRNQAVEDARRQRLYGPVVSVVPEPRDTATD